MLQLPHTAVSIWVEKQILRLGGAVSWIWLLLLIIIVLNVVMRYLFGLGRIEFEEIQWHLYAIGFLLEYPTPLYPIPISGLMCSVKDYRCSYRPGLNYTALSSCYCRSSPWFCMAPFRLYPIRLQLAKYQKHRVVCHIAG